MASLVNTVYSKRFSSHLSAIIGTPHLPSRSISFSLNRRRRVVRATETVENEDRAPAESGSSINQILGIKGAKQETRPFASVLSVETK